MIRTGSFLILCLCVLEAHAAIPTVKVLIGKSLNRVVVEGMDLQKTIHQQKKSETFSGRKAISFNCVMDKKKVSHFNHSPFLVATLKSPTGLISWDHKKYQGNLHLLTSAHSDSCDLVNEIPMEAYLRSLLAKEMNGTWPLEALKAQAVAARTYAYNRVLSHSNIVDTSKLYHLESSEKDQVSGSFFDVTEKTLRASKETEGEVLVGPSGKIAPAFFHSKCGGKTLRPDQVWGGVEEGYRSVNCTFCQKTGMKDWQTKIRNTKLTQMIDQALKRYYADQVSPGEIKVMPDTLENSELRLYVGDRLHIIKKSYLRNTVGREVLPSNNFIMTSKNGVVEVSGQGYGHGVGLCQLGALELAKRGYDYKQILSFYFPRHRMKKVY
jgi:stage II sporulation protein D